MAYFLRKTQNPKKGIYLSIYDSRRDPETKKPRSYHYKTLGYVSDLIEQGIEDPISFYTEEVKKLNEKVKEEKRRKKEAHISKTNSFKKYLGYFPLERIARRLNFKQTIDLLQTQRDFKFSIYDCLMALVYSRAVKPCSKKRTVEQILPNLYGEFNFSYEQVRATLEFCGQNYKKLNELITSFVRETYILDTSKTFFDCTNFYFEIDREDSFRRKGPSKENRKDPIVGLGLILDANCIPLGMRMYPGNQSEKPILRDIIYDLKKQSNITGKTIQVADKGLNCAQNIIEALNYNNGYLFSKSVKLLNKKEWLWVSDDNGFIPVLDENGKVLYMYKEGVDEFTYAYKTDKGRLIRKTVLEKRIVTFNESLRKKQIAEIDKMVAKAKDLTLAQATKNQYGESARYVKFESVDENGLLEGRNAKAILRHDKIEKDKMYCGYNLLVTSEIKMKPTEIYNTYHRLWRIEESFRCLKSQLDARPVFLQDENRIKGHFFVCYLALLLERLFQVKVLDDKFSSEEIFELFRGFEIAEISRKEYLNLSVESPLIEYLSKTLALPLTLARLSQKDIKKILGH